MSGTGLLTERCDPYGAESTIKLFGGVYPESMKGRYNWYCEERAEARFRLVCVGGDYGQRIAPDGGAVAGYTCPGGHRGPVMPLCRKHQRELGTRGEQRPRALRSAAYDGEGREQHWAPGSQVGGTKANELCPACAMPPKGREFNERAGWLAGEIGRYEMLGMGFAGPVQQLRADLEGVRMELDLMNLSGEIHRCPLKLVEVS